MFVTVRYGDNKEKIFNPYCRNDVFLKCIKLQCQLEPDECIELADERGVIKHLRRFPNDYAKDFLKNRETLVLLSIISSCEKSHSDDSNTTSRSSTSTTYKPLLLSFEHNQHFIDQLIAQRDDTMMESPERRPKSNMADADDSKPVRSRSRNGNSTAKRTSARRVARSIPLRKN